MRALSKREKIYVGVFIAALIWGVWNYRQMFFTDKGAAKSPQPIAAVSGSQAPNASISPSVSRPSPVAQAHNKPAQSVAQDYAWGSNPFHRDWR